MPTYEEEDKLNETDWSDIKQQYLKREELKEPCVICKEDLGSLQQVSLLTGNSNNKRLV